VNLTARITSQVFTGTVELQTGLFASGTDVRVVALRTSDVAEVGRMLTAGGAEIGEGMVHLEPGRTVSLGFRVTKSLRRGEEVAVHVLDAKTDRLLGSSKPARVGRDLEVEDDFALA
jgi:hypothetical protein